MPKITEEKILENRINFAIKFYEIWKGVLKLKDINQYTKKHSYMDVECLVCGNVFNARADHLLKGHGCPWCSKNHHYTNEEWHAYIEPLFPDIDFSMAIYVNVKTKVHLKCKICGCEWDTTPNNIQQGRGCPECGKKKVIEANTLKTEYVIKRAREVHGDKYEYPYPYIGMNKLWRIVCPIHGEFLQSPNNHINDRNECPDCSNVWKLEEDMKKFLTENNIDYITQYKQEWLGRLSCDFYLTNFNIVIECQGIQHFEPNIHFGGEENYLKCIERDERKRKLCEEHGIKILYFTNVKRDEYPYKVFLKFDDILKEIYV